MNSEGISLLLLGFTVLYFGCGPGQTSRPEELTRPKAKKVIEGVEQIRSNRLWFITPDLADPDHKRVSEACGEGILWTNPSDPKLTPEGTKYYESVRGRKYLLFVTKNPIHILEVTGITSGELRRSVEFTWEYKEVKDIPGIVMRCVEACGRQASKYGEKEGIQKGLALFVLYDDGWRVVRIENVPPIPPMPG